MKHIKKFENIHQDEVSILIEANSIIKKYIDTPLWNDIIVYLNEHDINYMDWTDLDILIFYLKNIDLIGENKKTRY